MTLLSGLGYLAAVCVGIAAAAVLRRGLLRGSRLFNAVAAAVVLGGLAVAIAITVASR